ncbi:hypothetical protein BP00DRAFT_167475 [Aspergillus indologenus CBS 114.80]|uniref:Uncharacterized protein n=1 Tax=Aspergillus indologenus CBS 114.80 TaxID=1450541 RepID=A0A2V5J2Z3_9EURO|nr:hypothetical protein BP00DRAFT_167475 [Aspergillus indologenus CBS 114.80]
MLRVKSRADQGKEAGNWEPRQGTIREQRLQAQLQAADYIVRGGRKGGEKLAEQKKRRQRRRRQRRERASERARGGGREEQTDSNQMTDGRRNGTDDLLLLAILRAGFALRSTRIGFRVISSPLSSSPHHLFFLANLSRRLVSFGILFSKTRDTSSTPIFPLSFPSFPPQDLLFRLVLAHQVPGEECDDASHSSALKPRLPSMHLPLSTSVDDEMPQPSFLVLSLPYSMCSKVCYRYKVPTARHQKNRVGELPK